MSDQATLDAQAQALRAEGLTYKQIGERMGGESARKAWMRCNREREQAKVRKWKSAHREQLREYDRRYTDENRYVCPECGHVYGIGSAVQGGRKRKHVHADSCPGCIAKRRERVIAWWAEGLSLREMADRLGWTVNHLGVELNRMRGAGFELPYRHHSMTAERVARLEAMWNSGATAAEIESEFAWSPGTAHKRVQALREEGANLTYRIASGAKFPDLKVAA